jgi:hypothetical protein
MMNHKPPTDQQAFGDAHEPDDHDEVSSEPHDPAGDPPVPPHNNTPAPPTPPEPDDLDPFDLDRLRQAQDLSAAGGVREVLSSVKFGKPSKESFFRVHPSPDYRIRAGVIEKKEEDSACYWVDPSLWLAMADEPTFSPRAVFTAVTRQGVLFLWGCRLPGPDGKSPDWISIPLEAAKMAETRWTKMFWDQNHRKHRVMTAPALTDEPQWPDVPFQRLLQLAFKDRVITSFEDPILKGLRGEL